MILEFSVVATLLAVQDAAPPPVPADPVILDGFIRRELGREPFIQDPVAIDVMPDGSILIAETERTLDGVMDNRVTTWHLEDDLQASTVQDRLDYMRKWAHKLDGGMDFYRQHPDRVRRAVDADGDGLLDEFTIFAGGFQEPLDGIGAGVMVVGDEVWYTNIPNLWRLRDEDADGVAEIREPIHSGFGVRFALYGHDMHGLVPGPDGRIYWSIGDRGYHVETPDGRILADPRSGAVFRCERDGTDLEVFASGLRNPQELAFNSVGDLFTGENTSDAGDRARIVYVAEGGETGWTMEYQTLEGGNLRGPWEQERIWEVVTPENERFRPDWTLPPVAHLGSGPAGLTYAPGIGFPSRYDDHFFMCDFLGTPEQSIIWAFRAEPDGAGYRIEGAHEFIRGLMATDVTFDWEGRMLLSQWGAGWRATGRGRLQEVDWEDRDRTTSRDRDEIRSWIMDGFENVDDFTIADLLSDSDRRVRLSAQNELVDRAAEDRLLDVAKYADDRVARSHGIWGTAQLARMRSKARRRYGSLMDRLLPLLEDGDPEIRAQTARVMGDPPHPNARDLLIERLTDDDPRIRYHAAMSLGKIGDPVAAPHLMAMLASDGDSDRFLRHAAVVALATINDSSTNADMMFSPVETLRRAATLAMRRNADPRVDRMLFDPEPSIRTEAARAIHDLPLTEAMPSLADLGREYASLDRAMEPVEAPLLRRIMSAMLTRGSAADLETLVSIAGNDRLSEAMRLEALASIEVFQSPDPRDRVLGQWRPVTNAPRDAAMISDVLATGLPTLILSDGSDAIRSRAMEIAALFDVDVDADALFVVLDDERKTVSERASALRLLTHLQDPRADPAIDAFLDSDDSEMRVAARACLLLRRPDDALDSFLKVLDRDEDGDTEERRAAILALGEIDDPRAEDRLLAAWIPNGLEPAWGVELLEASDRAGTDALRARVDAWRTASLTTSAPWSVAMADGDVREGARIARNHAGATCLRCHVIEGIGGLAGPRLDGIGMRLDRASILESIVDPQAIVAEGYGVTSAMPDVRSILSPREVRDLVTYLESLDEESSGAH